MRRLFAILLLLCLPVECWAAYTEFYCNADTGSNVNSGSTESATPVLQLTGGDWNSGTGVYTKTGAVTGVSTGMFASVMVDGASVAALVGRVTGVTANTVTISTAAKSGSLANQTGTATITVGGCWKGPNGSVAFPFAFLTGAPTDASSNPVRANFKNNATYSITSAMSHTAASGLIAFQGYTTTAGDGGQAIIDGGTSGSSYVLLTASGGSDAIAGQILKDLIFQNNGATGNADGIALTNSNYAKHFLIRVVVNSVRGDGIAILGQKALLDECEVYAANQSNTSGDAAFKITSDASLSYCIAHDNAGGNTSGFLCNTQLFSMSLANCISDHNGGIGIRISGGANAVRIDSCDSYDNGSDGLQIFSASFGTSVSIVSSNFVKNGGWGINNQANAASAIRIQSCGFGSGTQVNVSGKVNGVAGDGSLNEVTYASNTTPWIDPASGDFRINDTAAKGTGRGAFTQTQSGYTGTVAFPDIGASQHQDSGGSSGSPPFSVGIGN